MTFSGNLIGKFLMPLLRVLAVTLLVFLLVTAVSAQVETSGTDGQTPLGIAPGAPAGSYALSGFDNVNLYNGNLNFRLPLLHIDGRGGSDTALLLAINNKRWRVKRVAMCSGSPPPPDCTFFNYYPTPNWWTSVDPGYGPGVMEARHSGANYGPAAPPCFGFKFSSALTRITFTAPDGTEFELRDQLYGGQSKTFTGCIQGVSRGNVFTTADGSTATFISCASDGTPINIFDSATPGQSSPSGLLFMKDGTRYRIDNGLVTWLQDRNGNRTNFTYDTYRRVDKITDSLKREVTITYKDNVTTFNDTITFKGFGGAVRTIKVYYTNLGQVLRNGNAQGSSPHSLQTYQQLFPQLDGGSSIYDPINIVSAVELPDGRRYEFFYNSYGELARVELPTGGAYEYDYTQLGSGVVSEGDGQQIYRRVLERRVYADGTTLEGKMTYASTVSFGAYYTNLVEVQYRDGSGSLLGANKHYFWGSPTVFGTLGTDYAVWKDGKEYKTEAMAANGITALKRSENTWQQRAPVSWWSADPELAPPNDPRVIKTVMTWVDTNQVSQQESSYDQYNNMTESKEYDYGVGSPGPLIRRTQTDYLTTNSVNGINYTTINSVAADSTIHIRGLVKEQFIYLVDPSTGAQTLAARNQFEYDRYDGSTGHSPLMARSAISGLGGSFTTSYLSRGNATATSRWLNTTGGWLNVYQQYDVAGNVVKVIDARGYASTFDFSDRFGSPNGEARSNTSPAELAASGKSSYAFPTLETNSLGHTAYTQYDYYIGRAIEEEDENGVIASGYYNDLLDRPTQLISAVNDPILKNQTSFIYNNASRTITISTDQNAYGDNRNKSEQIYDGLGRNIEMRDYETASTFIVKRQTYDGMGRVSQVSNSFRLGDNIFWTTASYDTLGRLKNVIKPDNSQVTMAYSGNTVTVTDAAGKVRRCVKDSLNRITRAIEDPFGLNYQTDYTYDALDNLKRVTQNTQTRNFTYDTIGRMVQATIPEQDNPTSYSYDSNSNVVSRTNPRGIVTIYTYDPLNRIQTRTYQNDPANTPPVTYSYDAPAVAYSKGQLTQVSSSVSTYSYNQYDALGRIKQTTQTTNGQSYSMNYEYDIGGNMISLTYPSGRTVTTTYDDAGRITSLTGQKAGEANKTYADSFDYTPHGITKALRLGNGLWEHTISNSRLQLVEIGLGTFNGDSSKMKLQYGFGTTNNNGNILSQAISIGSTTISQSYSYDQLNRLSSVQEAVNTLTRWTQTYGYDRYANRTSLINGGSEGGILPTQQTPPVNNSNNRLSGASYDFSGNLLNDGASSLTYSAEDLQISHSDAAGSSTYSYDGNGRRVMKTSGSVTTIFVYGFTGQLIAEYNNPVQPVQGGGGTSYLTPDHVGSIRIVTDANGNVKARHDYFPFGEEIEAGIGSRTTAMGYSQADGLRHKFTSKERDKESGLDYFGARYYSSTQARFTGVDPLDESAVLTMPQSWNRYNYVLNNPLNIIDPDGMGWVRRGSNVFWDWGVSSDEQAKKKYGKNAEFIPEGTIVVVLKGSTGRYADLIGHNVILGVAGRLIDQGKERPVPPEAINFWSGRGTKFLAWYFQFAAENIVESLTGAKAAEALALLYKLARAKKASKATLEMIKGYCFVAGTLVETNDGKKAIEKLKVGDEVLASDPECGETGYEQVMQVIERTAPVLLDIKIGKHIISCTPEHPFWVVNKGWLQASDLEVGSRLLTEDRKLICVESINRREGSFKVYNLEVERLHTYYASEIGILVHNGKCMAGGEFADDSAKVFGTLREAVKTKGNFGIGSATRQQADELGRAWVGDGFSVASDGKTLLSADGLRQYRPPSFKPNIGKVQANLEWRTKEVTKWLGNAHIDILP